MMSPTLQRRSLAKTAVLLRFAILLCLSVPGAGFLYAQTISGKVTDEKGEPMPGVNVILKASPGVGTITDFRGDYSIVVSNEDAVLIFSFIGYVKTEVNVEGRSVVNIAMSPDVQTLEDIVVVGYGTQKKSEISSSISIVSGRDLENTTVSNVAMALQGRAPGVEVLSNGTPGRTPSIRIRGIGSINATDPLIVLDGVPVETDVFAQLAPSEIQSIEILKDASAGAIYGTRAANGVVLITTKGGKRGERTTVRINSSAGTNSVIKHYNVLNGEDLYMLKRESYTMDGLAVPASSPWANEYYNATRTNWQDEFFQTGLFQDYNITVSGGSETSTTNAHLNYRDEEGTQINTRFRRYGFSLRTTQEISERLRIEGNLRINQTNDHLNYDAQASAGTLFAAYFFHPSIPVRYGNGDFGSSLDPAPFSEGDWGSGRAHNDLGDMWNPIYKATEEWYKTSSQNAIVNLKADLDITDAIVLSGRAAYTHRIFRDEVFNKPTPLQSRTIANPVLTKGNSERSSWLGELFATYNQAFGRNNLVITAGTTAQIFEGEVLQMRGEGFASIKEKHLTLSNANVLTGSGSPADPTALASFFIRSNSSFADNRYYLSATLRADGSSRFADGNRWGYFPAVSAAWRISNEKFMSSFQESISNLKLNVSWGQLGNQNVNPFQYLTVYVKDQNYILGGRNVIGTAPSSFANPDITWETAEIANLLLEIGLFNDKVNIEAGYFDKKTRDLLIPTIRQFTMGMIGIPDSNNGDIRNHGFEFEVSTNHTIANNISLNVGVNAAFIKNKLIKLHGEDSFIASGPARTYEGGSLSAFYGWKTDGIYQTQEEINSSPYIANDPRRSTITPGDVRFVDLNGDGIIGDEDRAQIGDPNPLASIGMNMDLGYKGFRISANFSGRVGFEVYDAIMLRNMQPYEKFNMHANALQRWTGPGTSDKWPRLSRIAANQNYRESDLAIKNADYLRLKDLVVSYTVPSKHFQSIGIQNLRLYVLGRNLMTITSADDLVDPEENSSFSNIRRGIIGTEYPQSKTFAFGLDVTF